MFKKILSSLKSPNIGALPMNYNTDLHSHLIPGIDDGVKTLEESIEIISKMKNIGFNKIITTPHIMSHRYKNTKENILSGCEKVKKELKKQNIDIELEVAAEYYFDEHFLDLIEKDDLLIIGDAYVLFELSYTSKPFGLEQTIFNMLSKGYKPILAHPERYTFLYSNLGKYDKLKDSGVRFQININSLVGFYGKKPKKAAEYLVKNGLVDFLGSDIHAMKYFDSFSKAVYSNKIHEIFESNKIKNQNL